MESLASSLEAPKKSVPKPATQSRHLKKLRISSLKVAAVIAIGQVLGSMDLLTFFLPLWESCATMPRITSKIIHLCFPRYIPASERPQKVFRYPELGPSDVENAKLFAGRESLVKYLASGLRGGTLAEVGVMYGDFSDFILRTIEPELFIAIDRYNSHTLPVIWGKSSADRFQGMTQRQFYEKRFSGRGKQVRCEEGDSCECLARYPDQTFDMIYIDAGHDYESVKRDADLSKQKIKPEGILIFNDYIKYSHYDDSYYGIIPVVNDLVVNQGFEVLGFALQADMYCDIAIRRRAKKS